MLIHAREELYPLITYVTSALVVVVVVVDEATYRECGVSPSSPSFLECFITVVTIFLKG